MACDCFGSCIISYSFVTIKIHIPLEVQVPLIVSTLCPLLCLCYSFLLLALLAGSSGPNKSSRSIDSVDAAAPKGSAMVRLLMPLRVKLSRWYADNILPPPLSDSPRLSINPCNFLSDARFSVSRVMAASRMFLICSSSSPRVDWQRPPQFCRALIMSGIVPGARSRRGAMLDTWMAWRAGSSVACKRPA